MRKGYSYPHEVLQWVCGDRTPRWVSPGECQTLRSICQVHRDCSSLILGVILLRYSAPESFPSVVLVHRSSASFRSVVPSFCRSFSGVVLAHRSATSFCYVALLRRSSLSFCHV